MGHEGLHLLKTVTWRRVVARQQVGSVLRFHLTLGPKKNIFLYMVSRPSLFFPATLWFLLSLQKKKKSDSWPPIRVLVPVSPGLKSRYRCEYKMDVPADFHWSKMAVPVVASPSSVIAFKFIKCNYQQKKSFMEATNHHQTILEIYHNHQCKAIQLPGGGRAVSRFTKCIGNRLLCFGFRIESIKSVSKKISIKNFEVNVPFSERYST